jgi:cation transporter-like permease
MADSNFTISTTTGFMRNGCTSYSKIRCLEFFGALVCILLTVVVIGVFAGIIYKAMQMRENLEDKFP